MRFLKITLSIIFVFAICFLVVKGCVQKRTIHPRPPVFQKATTKVTPATSLGPQMAIILDDWGHNFALVKNAEDIRRPLTLAILPHLPQSRRIAEAAHVAGLGVMLHMPMQPKDQKDGLEAHTIRVTASETEILRYLDEALTSVPFVEGVNNHQGSLATSYARVMNIVLSHLKNKNLFFIDSFVISTSVASTIAKEKGMRFTKRDVFIDNDAKLESIKTELRRAIQKAIKNGRVVVIGHDKTPTIQAIKEMVPEIEKAGVKLVLVKELLV